MYRKREESSSEMRMIVGSFSPIFPPPPTPSIGEDRSKGEMGRAPSFPPKLTRDVKERKYWFSSFPFFLDSLLEERDHSSLFPPSARATTPGKIIRAGVPSLLFLPRSFPLGKRNRQYPSLFLPLLSSPFSQALEPS